jgi:hypothetical protein
MWVATNALAAGGAKRIPFAGNAISTIEVFVLVSFGDLGG